ncbi:MAG TPA: coproporphyrinogen III oxidase family protein, partial [Bacteroidales bacterium]|nr:coproporphyrinogen III oxidase family protein [Bacteroidales bacterium]
SRQWNIAGIGPYLESVNKGIVPFEMEMLTKAQRFNEYVMTSLRTMWGCDLKEIEKMFGESWAFQALADARQFLENKMMVRKDGVLYLTNDGLFHADGIASEFFRVE